MYYFDNLINYKKIKKKTLFFLQFILLDQKNLTIFDSNKITKVLLVY